MSNTTSLPVPWAGTLPLANINQTFALDPSLALVNQQADDPQRFWATPNRSASSTTTEVLQVTLGVERLINRITFDLSHFPCDVTAEYLDPTTRQWMPCLDASAAVSTPISAGLRDSLPTVLPPISAIGGHLHPQHSFSGHWQHIEMAIHPITTSHLRLLLLRNTTGSCPTDNFGKRIDYSLAVRRLSLGYVVTTRKDIPSAAGTFAFATDLLGSPVSYSLRVNAAENVLRNTSATGGGQASQQLIWKCDPQPVPWAVINFYLDVRDPSGFPQVIDQLYVDPLYTGPAMNIYYSNDDPTTTFTPGFDPFPQGAINSNDSLALSGNILHSGLAGVGDIAFIDIDNTAVGYDPTHSWWFGGVINSKIAHTTDMSSDQPIIDTGDWQCCLTPTGFLFSTSGNDYLSIPLLPFDAATPVQFLLSYDASARTVAAWIQVGSIPYTGAVTLTTTPQPVTNIRVGGFQSATPGMSNLDFTELVLKTDDVPNAATITAFLTNPDPYVLNASYLDSQDSRVDNALLRYHVAFVDAVLNPTGFVGGPPDRYADLSWTPITRDFVLRKGYCNFSPTSTKYIKLEFSGLVPENYEVYEPIQRTVLTYPASRWPTAGNSPASVDQQIPGTTASWRVNLMLAANQYTGGVNPIVGTGGLPGKNYTQTSVRVLTNIEQQARLATVNWAWRFLPSSSPTVMPSFPTTGPHNYEEIDITQVTKVAYFVGLKSVAVYRTDYSNTADTDQYVDLFFDTMNVAVDTNFLLPQAHVLTSGGADYAKAQSVIFNSQRVVSAVQFATVQSDPRQMLPDDGFDDATHTNWSVVGDATFAPGIVENQIVGSTLQISRNATGVTWDLLTSTYATYQRLQSISDTSYTSIMRGFSVPLNSGGVSSGTITSPPGGRVYAAGRVIAPADLTSPLYVQIIDDDTGNVLAADAIDVKANAVTEWYTGYHIGDGVDAVPLLWSDFSAPNTAVLMQDSFGRANATTLGAMTTTQVWDYDLDSNGNPLSLQIASNTATSTAQGEYSYVSTGSQWGSLEFSVPNAISNTAITGPNLLLNGTFESGTITPWTVAGATISPSASGTAHTGIYALKIVNDGVTAGPTVASEQYLGIIPGASYSLSVWGWFTSAVTSTHWGIGIAWFDANHNAISTPTTTANASAATWTHSTLTATAPSGASYAAVTSTLAGTPSAGQIWYLDDVTITTGAESWLAELGPLGLDVAGELMMTSGAAFEAPNASVLVPGGSGTQSVIANDDIRIDAMPTIVVPSGKKDVTQAIVDPVATPYSLVIYRNGTWVRTVSHDRGASSLAGLKGNQGQKFATFAFTPLKYGAPPTPTITGLPTGKNGGWGLGQGQTVQNLWIDKTGREWLATGTWATSGVPPRFAGRDDCGSPLVATANGSTFVTNVQSFYGAMTTHVTSLAGPASGTPHGNVLVLDLDHGVFVNAQGNIMVNGLNYGSLFPSGIPTGKNITVQWAQTSRVNSTTLGSINPSQFPDMIIAKVSGAIVGRFAHGNLSIWRGTKRGVAGDAYTGTPPTWMGPLQANTAFRAFVWAPDASNIALDPTQPTWNTVTQDAGLTYDDVIAEKALVFPNLRAQLVQYGPSKDVWDVDALSMYIDPIIWSFSTDGGYTFVPAYEIRNNPQGVLAFPQSIAVTNLSQLPGTGLVWKVVSYAPDSVISSLVIRPWYAGLLSGNSQRVGLAAQGPNVMPYDHFGDINNDAAFQTWNKPIPREWFFAYRSLTATVPIASMQQETFPGDNIFPGPLLYPGSS